MSASQAAAWQRAVPVPEEVLAVQGLEYQRLNADGSPALRLCIPRLVLSRGEAVAVTGPSGCGKSTLVDLLTLLRRPARTDRLTLMGFDAAQLWAKRDAGACTALRGRHVGVVLQTGGLLASLPLIENIELSCSLLGYRDPHWIRHLLQALDLSGLESRLPAQLSVGQRQRCAIARALAHRPALLVADEPTAALGPNHAGAALDLLISLAHEGAASLLVVSHDHRLLRSRGLRILPMQQGEAGHSALAEHPLAVAS